MTRSEFLKTNSCTRGQLDLIIEKSRSRKDGQIETEWGIFRISKKGKAKTSPVTITPVKRSAAKPDPSASVPAARAADPELPEDASLPAELMRMSDDQLKRALLVAQVRGAQQKLEGEKREIRKEVLGELVSAVTACFGEFREALDRLRLDETSLKLLKDALDRALERVAEL